MKLNSEQKKTLSGILGDLGKLIFVSIVIGKFVSDVKIPDYIFYLGLVIMLLLFIYSIFMLKKVN